MPAHWHVKKALAQNKGMVFKLACHVFNAVWWWWWWQHRRKTVGPASARLMFDEFCCCRKVFIIQRRADFIFQLVVTFPHSMLLLASSICSSADSRLCGSLACGAPSFSHVLPLLLRLWQTCKDDFFFRTRSNYFWFLETVWIDQKIELKDESKHVHFVGHSDKTKSHVTCRSSSIVVAD